MLARWFNGEGSALQVVTGKPGVGKSALLGVLVCAAHPQLRNYTQPLWSSLPKKPAWNDRLVVVHARRRSLEEIADSLARQMGAPRRTGRLAVGTRKASPGWRMRHLGPRTRW